MSGLIDRVTDSLVKNGTILSEDRDLYNYGLEQGMVMLANIITTLAIGLAFGMLWQCTIFMITYLPLRTFAGGYHARTQFRCYIYSVVLTVLVLFAIILIPWTYILSFSIALIAGIIILALAPVEDENKPLDSVEVKVYKAKALKILSVEFILDMAFMLFQLLQVSICISTSLLALSIMLILGKIRNASLKPE